jgi:hypothetical protein
MHDADFEAEPGMLPVALRNLIITQGQAMRHMPKMKTGNS